MGDSNFFKGTSTDQDRRFADKESKLLKTMKFPKEFEQKVRRKQIYHIRRITALYCEFKLITLW
jgi:hypothetical protein